MNFSYQKVIEQLKYLNDFQVKPYDDLFLQYIIQNKGNYQLESENNILKNEIQQKYKNANKNEQYQKNVKLCFNQLASLNQDLQTKIEKLVIDNLHNAIISENDTISFRNQILKLSEQHFQHYLPFSQTLQKRKILQYIQILQNDTLIIQFEDGLGFFSTENNKFYPSILYFKQKIENKISGNGQHILISCNNQIQMYDYINNALLYTLQAHLEQISEVFFIKNNIFITCSINGIVKIWNGDNKQLIKAYKFKHYITCMNSLPELQSNIVVCGFNNGQLSLFQFSSDYKSYIVLKQMQINEQKSIDFIQIYKKRENNLNILSNYILGVNCSDLSSEIYLIDFNKNEKYQISQNGFQNSAKYNKFDFNEKILLAGSDDFQVFIWSIEDLFNPNVQVKQISLSKSLINTNSSPIIFAKIAKEQIFIGDCEGILQKFLHK